MTLPLFPLNTVLFPGCNLDLQIFEARYLDMIGRCMKQGGGFGVVCITEGEQVGSAPDAFAAYGCQAVIEDFQQQDNGLLGIRVKGGQRFEVDDFELLKDNLLVADVRWLNDEPDQPLEETMTICWPCSWPWPITRWWQGWTWPAGSRASTIWVISWRICCRSTTKTRSRCWPSTLPPSAWRPSRIYSTACRKSCWPEPQY